MREQPGEDTKERLRKALQHFKILPQTSDRQQMTEEERYIDYGFEHRVTAVKGIYSGFFLIQLMFDWLLHEMLFIRELKPTLNVQSDSIRVKVFV